MRVTVFDNDCFLQKEYEILNSTVATLWGNCVTVKSVLLAAFVWMSSFVSNKKKKVLKY